MKTSGATLLLAAFLAALLSACGSQAETAAPEFGGTALDQKWKRTLHARMSNGILGTRGDLLQAEVRYAGALAQAAEAGATVDRDVLFAAILLRHARPPGGRARGRALLADEVLLPLGFPPEKLPAVRALLAKPESFGTPAETPAEWSATDANLVCAIGSVEELRQTLAIAHAREC
ncbi:MAG: hypothetical protein WDZ63_04590 [Burkholderiales bacterium]